MSVMLGLRLREVNFQEWQRVVGDAKWVEAADSGSICCAPGGKSLCLPEPQLFHLYNLIISSYITHVTVGLGELIQMYFLKTHCKL